MSVGEGTAGVCVCEWTIAQKTSSASSVAIVRRSRSLGVDLVAVRRGGLVPRRLEAQRAAAVGRRRGRRRSGRTPRSGIRPGRGRRSRRGSPPAATAAGPGPAVSRSPPVDAALERLLHLVEVRRERAGREVLPAAVGEQRDDRARTSSSAATRAAATSTAPHDGPAKMPSRKTSSRSAAIASRFETRYFASISDGSRISGMNPSSSERRPWTSSPGSGSAATIRTPGLCSRR